ncbi:hypothetical protein V1264_020815 [Littorina saxatilis]|uniref:Uncharacterized protein n=1 Tax=Littorina saxatilis TaxID=31220 RepID=A0AAN9BB17_9CAEN
MLYAFFGFLRESYTLYQVRFTVSEDAEHAMVIEIIDISGTVDRLWLRVLAQADEKVYGAGEQFTHFNLRGRSFPLWVREQGTGRNKSSPNAFYDEQTYGGGGDYHTTNFPQPSYISSRGYYLYHEGPDYVVMDFTHDNFHEVFVLAERSVSVGRMRLQNGSDEASLVGHLTNFLGHQPPLPVWIHSGAILGIQGGTTKLQERLGQAEEHGVAVSAVWILDWAGPVSTSSGQTPLWDWQWNQQLYPGLPSVIAELVARGIRVLGYVNPYLRTDGQLYAVAEENDYFVKSATNQTFIHDFGGFFSGTIDLTNPAAYDWYKNEVVKKNMIEFGFSGWMADFGEYLPIHGVSFHSGQSAEELHNQWPVMWAQLNRQAVEEAGKLGDVVFWTRAGFSGTGNYTTLLWAGDQNVDWSLSDGLASTLTAALSVGMSGVALTHYDIGGFTTFASYTPPLVRTEELLLRSAEMAVFTPVFRTHEGSEPSANVQFYSSRGTLLKFARLSRMFSAMMNYTRHVVDTSSTTGLPAQRPLFLNNPSDEPSYDVSYQYMYGDDLLVAPVYLPHKESWDVYLPSDPEASWVFLWDESIVSSGGGTVRVAAPLGHPPVFYRNVSEFVEVFRKVASEPLVNLPPYVPKPGPSPTPGENPGEGPDYCSSSAIPLRLGRYYVLVLLAVVKLFLM